LSFSGQSYFSLNCSPMILMTLFISALSIICKKKKPRCSYSISDIYYILNLQLHTCILDNRYVPFVIIIILSFPHLWLITRFVTRVTWWVPLVEQELLPLPQHLSSSTCFWGGIRVA
jgi:hypothetical protein